MKRCSKGAGFCHTICFALMLLISLSPAVHGGDPPGWKHLEKGKDYLDEGKLSAAVIEFKNALQANPDNVEARLLLGRSYLRMNKGAEAEKELRRAHDAGLGFGEVAVPLGEALLLQGKSGEFLEQLNDTGSLSDVASAEIHALRGEAHLGEGDAEAAAREFEAALKLQPQLPRALLGQARLAMVERDMTAARAKLDKALAQEPANAIGWSLRGDLEQSLGNDAQAEQAYGKAIENSFDGSMVQMKRALVRIEMEDYTGAASDLAAAEKSIPDHPALNYSEGVLAFRQGDAAKALPAFERVLNQQPANAYALFYAGASSYALGNLEQADSYLGRFVSAHPRSDRARTLLGMARLQRKDFAGAEAAIRPVLSRSPEEPLALRTLGKALLAQGKAEEGNRYLAKAVSLQPDSADDRVDLAISMLRMGQEEAGIRELEAAIQLDPQQGKADILLIEEHLQAGEYDKALKAAERLRGKWPKSPAPLILMGIAQGGKGDLAKARSHFEAALKLRPGEPSAAANLAALELKDGNNDKARGYYQQVLKAQPGHLQTLLTLARLESRLGNDEAARARLEEAARANPAALEPRLLLARSQMAGNNPLKALTTLNEVKERHGNNPHFLAAVGEAQMAAGEAANAVRTFRKIVEQRPQSARAHYLLANAHAANKDQKGLGDALFKGLKLQPDHLLADGAMSLYVRSAANLKEAEKRVEELKKIQPAHPQVIDLDGQLALSKGEAARAVTLYSRLNREYPNSTEWILRLAQAQWQAGKRDDHLATLSNWLKANPNDVRVQYMLANSYLQLERHDDAVKAFTRVIEAAPENVLALNNLAWLLRAKEPQKALVYAEKARALSPNDAGIMDTLGVVLMQQGELAKAVDVLQEAVRVRPDMLTVKYHLASALARQGKREQARKELQRLLNLEQEFPERKQAQALLTELGG